MKIIFISDTQLPKEELIKYLTVCQKICSQADQIIFLGDGYNNVANFLAQFPNVICIKGGHDKNSDLPKRREFNINGLNFLLIHGDHDQKIREEVNILENKFRKLIGLPFNLNHYYSWLYNKYASKFDIVVYGHIHIPKIEIVGKTVFFCPGAIPPQRLLFGGYHSIGLIEIPENLKSKFSISVYAIDIVKQKLTRTDFKRF